VIPTAFLQAWSMKAPWPDLRQVEQDLIICRALCELFNAPTLAGKIAFRGGTAIHKLLFKQPLRYSEDIDLVQAHPEPIGGTVDAIRAALSWLGTAHAPLSFRQACAFIASSMRPAPSPCSISTRACGMCSRRTWFPKPRRPSRSQRRSSPRGCLLRKSDAGRPAAGSESELQVVQFSSSESNERRAAGFLRRDRP
jgi:hypothetical protein